MRQTELKPEFVEYIPSEVPEGVLFISKEYGVAVHMCACGCGNKTVMPFGRPGDWTLFENPNGTVSFEGSVGNWSFPCRSHYHITENKVRWD